MFRAPQVNFYVENIEATARFCRGLLGFTETFRTPQQGTPIHAELRLDGFTLGLATIESLRDLHGVTVAVGPPRADVVVWTDDVDAAFADLSGKGARVLSPPRDFLASLRAAWIADPEGNPVQIVMRRGRTPGLNPEHCDYGSCLAARVVTSLSRRYGGLQDPRTAARDGDPGRGEEVAAKAWTAVRRREDRPLT